MQEAGTGGGGERCVCVCILKGVAQSKLQKPTLACKFSKQGVLMKGGIGWGGGGEWGG